MGNTRKKLGEKTIIIFNSIDSCVGTLSLYLSYSLKPHPMAFNTVDISLLLQNENILNKYLQQLK